jgi:hypothetical protein
MLETQWFPVDNPDILRPDLLHRYSNRFANFELTSIQERDSYSQSRTLQERRNCLGEHPTFYLAIAN